MERGRHPARESWTRAGAERRAAGGGLQEDEGDEGDPADEEDEAEDSRLGTEEEQEVEK